MTNLFDIFLIVYYIFFAGLFVLAGNVYSKLKNLSERISKKEFNKAELNFEIYKSSESLIMHSYPKFPLAALVKILPGTFVGLGILGTFIGFSDGISEISLTGNVDELFGKLDIFFAGLNTAFITSIIGVVLSVFFGIIYQFPLNKIKFHCEKIYSQLIKELDSEEKSKVEFDSYILSIQEITKTLLTAKESIENLPQKFLEVEKSLEESILPIKETFSTMQSTLEESILPIKETFGTMQSTLEESILPIKETFGTMQSTLEESILPIKETFGTMQSTLVNYSKQAENLQNASEQIQQTLIKFIENSEQTTLKVNTTLEQTISATKTIQENNAKLNEQISESHKAAMKDYQEIDENIGSILSKVNKNLTEYSKIIETTLVQTLEEYNKTAQKVTESFFGDKK
ncbi:hypothetical protein [uncultured Treponema sp.]|uniref:hypothetical protein n=1 Tax=uncultured Treponema sp. TaxID=162155 RepID=UPI0025EDE15B|nr:hypothetical protein [uncultured Treponema sp.]